MMNIEGAVSHSSDLCSINEIDHTVRGEERLKTIIKQSIKVGRNVIIYAERPELNPFSVDDFCNDNPIICEMENFFIDDFSVSFGHVFDFIDERVISSLIKIFHTFQFTSYLFVDDTADKEICRNLVSDINATWKDICNTTGGALLFKGVEEDVIWCGNYKQGTNDYA